jgi:uncharacterized DUF497 family protein
VDFDWDDGNRDKNLRHGVHDWEIEEAFQDRAGISVGARRAARERRRTLLARARTSGKYLSITYTVRIVGGRRLVRAVSALNMTAAERARYTR